MIGVKISMRPEALASRPFEVFYPREKRERIRYD